MKDFELKQSFSHTIFLQGNNYSFKPLTKSPFFKSLNKIHVIINVNGVVMKVRGKISLIVGWITLFLIGIDLFVVSPLLPFILEAYNTSPSMTGWMVTVFAITYPVFASFFGWLSDRNGRGAYIMLVALQQFLVLFLVPKRSKKQK